MTFDPLRAFARRAGPGRAAAALALAMVWPCGAAAQRSSIGLASAGGLGVHAGFDDVERNARGVEAGVLLDLGWIGSPALRLRADVAFMRATLTETVEQEGRTYRDEFFDLTGSVSLLLQRRPGPLLTPYLVGGLGVHALSSAFGSIVIDERYNANPLGSHLGVGAQLRLGRGGRHALWVEARRIIAEHVNRTSLRAGVSVLHNDLARRRQPTGAAGHGRGRVSRATSGSAPR